MVCKFVIKLFELLGNEACFIKAHKKNYFNDQFNE